MRSLAAPAASLLFAGSTACTLLFPVSGAGDGPAGCVQSREVENNDSRDRANAVCDRSRIAAAFNVSRDENWYVVDLAPNDSVSFASAGDCASGKAGVSCTDPAPADTLFFLYDEDSVPDPIDLPCEFLRCAELDDDDLACNDEDERFEEREHRCAALDFTAPQAGRYYLRVLDFCNCIEQYELRVDVTRAGDT